MAKVRPSSANGFSGSRADQPKNFGLAPTLSKAPTPSGDPAFGRAQSRQPLAHGSIALAIGGPPKRQAPSSGGIGASRAPVRGSNGASAFHRGAPSNGASASVAIGATRPSRFPAPTSTRPTVAPTSKSSPSAPPSSKAPSRDSGSNKGNYGGGSRFSPAPPTPKMSTAKVFVPRHLQADRASEDKSPAVADSRQSGGTKRKHDEQVEAELEAEASAAADDDEADFQEEIPNEEDIISGALAQDEQEDEVEIEVEPDDVPFVPEGAAADMDIQEEVDAANDSDRVDEQVSDEASQPVVEETEDADDGLDFDPWAHLKYTESMSDADFWKDELLEEEYGGFQDDFEPIEEIDESAVPNVESDVLPEPEEEEDERTSPEKDEKEGVAREGDLSLHEIPEDQREAVEGNLQLKRALSSDYNVPGSKRRRTDSGPGGMPRIENKVALRLAKQWKLSSDSTTSFVLRMADDDAVDFLAKSRWKPDPRHKRSSAEQVYEQVLRVKEKKGPPAGPLDAVAAFGHRWHLTAADDEALAQLDHKSLHHVFREYDKSRSVQELMTEASTAEIDASDLAVPDKPGLFVLGRSQCLELIDPYGDALILGDANLTFSIQLAEHRKALHHTGRTIATTFEKLETLRERYPEIDDTVKNLADLGCEVLHNVDCTRLAVDPRFQGMECCFGAVYYNFPHAGVVPGFFDGHPFVRWRHANLMHLFFRALRTFVKPGGLVKVASNSSATGVRYSDIISGAATSEFVHSETFPFLEWTLARYRRSYGDRRDENKRPEDGQVYNAQRANSDMVYCFTYRPSGDALATPAISYPPTKEELFSSNEGRAGRLPSGAVARKKRVEELYELFLSYVQGIHVG